MMAVARGDSQFFARHDTLTPAAGARDPLPRECSMADQSYREAVLGLLMQVRARILAGEAPESLRRRLVIEEQLELKLVDQVWVALRPQLIEEQEQKALRLRILGVVWLVAGGVLAAFTIAYPQAASTIFGVLACVALASGAIVFQLGSRAAQVGFRIASLDWSLGPINASGDADESA